MAPPLPLSNVAGTLALSFTAGGAAPVSEPATVEQPASVPAPPRLPPAPGETTGEDGSTTTERNGEGGSTDEGGSTTSTTGEAGPTTSTTGEGGSTTASSSQPSPLTSPDSPERAAPVGPFEAPDADEAPSREDVARSRAASAADLLRPNTKTRMFSLFVGGSRALRGSYSYYNRSDLKAEAAIGGHDERFQVGGFAVVQVTAGFPFNSFTLAPRLSLHRQIVPNHAFYFTTNVLLGWRATTYGEYGFLLGLGDAAYHSAVLGISSGVSAILGERLLLSFRPLELEVVVPTPSLVQLNWAAMGGLGVLWGRRRDR